MNHFQDMTKVCHSFLHRIFDWLGPLAPVTCRITEDWLREPPRQQRDDENIEHENIELDQSNEVIFFERRATSMNLATKGLVCFFSSSVGTRPAVLLVRIGV